MAVAALALAGGAAAFTPVKSFSDPWEAPAARAPPAGIGFNDSCGDKMVLQRAPEKACLSGTIGAGGTGATIKISSAADASYVGYEVAAIISASASDDVKLWKACLSPQAAGGDFAVTATCAGCNAGNSTATLSHVTFGDVWYCGGQSNMALPLMHTLSRNISRDAILKGKYANIRIHGIRGNMNPSQPWATLKDALSTNADSDRSNFGSYSSTCYYFGESLSDELAKSSANGVAPPIGLIHTSFGGSTIEQWLDNKTIATCANASISAANQEWHDSRVLPYIGTTVKGWVWYQGENDMHNLFGNSALHTGYSCLMKALVAQWRQLWSAEAGTTRDDAAFGLVTLAPSGTEGGSDIGTMRWAQTASYGVAPSPALPRVFVAQAYDLNEPFSNISCYHKVGCHDNSVPPNGSSTWGFGCDKYCASVKTSNFYMGPIHPRDKKPVGNRLAQAAAVVAYGGKGHSTGPTLAGCSMSGQKITVSFNTTLLAEGGADAIKIQPYYPGNVVVNGKKYDTIGSKMEVLQDESQFCMQAGGAGCRDDGTGAGSADKPGRWVAVDIAAGGAPNEVVVDLSKTNGTAFAIRYGWTGDCCTGHPPTSDPCPVASCPIMGSASGFPANPFIAHLVGGKCKCIAPQVCDE